MNPLPAPTASPLLDHPADELTQLELQIARRADELAGAGERSPSSWLQAEREVLARWMDERPAPSGRPGARARR